MKKIAIVCGSPGSMMMAPFEDESFEIWVLGNRLDAFEGKRITKIFEIHDDLSEHSVNYPKWLAEKKIPLIVGNKFPYKATHIEEFPFHTAKGLYGATYLTSSSAYMMALAILEGATHISIYGVDMAVDDFEYFWQRPCMEAWIGFAKGKGIEVYIPDISPIGKSDYIEGVDSGGKPNFKKTPFTEKEFLALSAMQEEVMANKKAQVSTLNSEIILHSGSIQTYQNLAKTARAVESGQNITSLTTTVRIKD